MKANIPQLVEIVWRTEGSASYDTEELKITLSEKDVENILKTQDILKDNPFMLNARIPVIGEVLYLDEEGNEVDSWRVDMEQFCVYSDGFYYYAQGKWDSGDQLESDFIQLTK